MVLYRGGLGLRQVVKMGDGCYSLKTIVEKAGNQNVVGVKSMRLGERVDM